jgi:hypothetical protein
MKAILGHSNNSVVAARHHTFWPHVGIGSISAAQQSDCHGRTCLNTGRQVTHLLCRFLIDEMIASTNGDHHACSTPESCRHGGRGWIPRWATCGRNRAPKNSISNVNWIMYNRIGADYMVRSGPRRGTRPLRSAPAAPPALRRRNQRILSKESAGRARPPESARAARPRNPAGAA